MKPTKSTSSFVRGALTLSLLMGSTPVRAQDSSYYNNGNTTSGNGNVTASTAAPAAGVDGVEFQPIPINLNNSCYSMILKGTQKYKGFAFKMPRVLLSVDKNLENLFEIIPKGNGQYTLRFGLFFPLDDNEYAVVNGRDRNNNMYVQAPCRDDLVLTQLNQMDQAFAAREQANRNGGTAGNKKVKPVDTKGTVLENKIYSLTPLPVSAIEVSINGFPGMTKTIGVAGNNLLNYQNTDLVADFVIPNESTYSELKEHLTGQMGLSLNVKMVFAAKASNGRADVELDTKNIADSLESALGGNANLLQGMVIADADLRSYMAQAISNSSMNVKIEQGSDENFTRLADNLINRISHQIPASAMIPGATWNPNCIGGGANCGNNQYGSSNYGTNYSSNDSYSSVGNPPPNSAVGPMGPVLNGPQGQAPQPVANASGVIPNTGYFKIGAVLSVLRQTQKINLTIENLGQREERSYTTNVVIRGDIPDPGFKTLNVIAGDQNGPSYIKEINTGDRVVLKIPSKRYLVANYRKRVKTFNRDEIRNYGATSYFPELGEALEKNMLTEEMDRDAQSYIGVYNKNSDVKGFTRYWNDWFPDPTKDLAVYRYVWGMAELVLKMSMNEPSDLDLATMDRENGNLLVTFSELGSRYKLADLTRDTDKWAGSFEDGQIVLIAKKKLGYLRIRNYEAVEAPHNRFPEKYFFEKRSRLSLSEEEKAEGKTLAQLTSTTYIKTSSNEKVDQPDLTNYSIRKSVYVVKVKVSSSTDVSSTGHEEVETQVGTSGGGDTSGYGTVDSSTTTP